MLDLILMINIVFHHLCDLGYVSRKLFLRQKKSLHFDERLRLACTEKRAEYIKDPRFETCIFYMHKKYQIVQYQEMKQSAHNAV